jgi:hypothetical protein
VGNRAALGGWAAGDIRRRREGAGRLAAVGGLGAPAVSGDAHWLGGGWP